MKDFGYTVVKQIIKKCLYGYFGEIKIVGAEHIPENGPVFFVANHQNALLDALLIATHQKRNPYYLARADVFKKPLIKKLLTFFHMMPVYRIRDGKSTLANNHAIFDACGDLLLKHESILIFPEGNHGLRRRVRPLSKGFTRIIFDALKKNPTLDIQLVPIGVNYNAATEFPDGAAIYFGPAVSVQNIVHGISELEAAQKLKNLTFLELTRLTTHISSLEEYDNVHAKLLTHTPDFLNPVETNKLLQTLADSSVKTEKLKGKAKVNMAKIAVKLLNFPSVLIWKYGLKGMHPDIEFASTLRFASSIIGSVLWYSILTIVVSAFIGVVWVLPVLVFQIVLSKFCMRYI